MTGTGTRGSWVWFELGFPSDVSHEAVTGFVRALSSRGRSGWIGRGRTVVIETSVTGTKWVWRLGVDRADVAPILQQLRAHLPQVHYTESPRTVCRLNTGVEVRLRSATRSTRTDVGDAAAAAILGAMTSLGRDETLVLQWVVGPWMARSPIPNPADNRPGRLPWRVLDTRPQLDGEQTKAARLKQSEPVFGVVGRIAVRAGSRSRCEQVLRRVFGGLQVVREPGAGFVRRLAPGSLIPNRVQRCVAPWWEWPCPLNAAELGSVLGWPIGGPMLPGVTYRSHRLLPANDRALVPDTVTSTLAGTRMGGDLRTVAKATYPNQHGDLVLRPVDALRHLHVLGPTGSGKSHLLANLIVQDIDAGRGVVVIEPKQDLITAVLERIPAHRLRDVVILDGTDSTAPVGINPLTRATGDRRELVVDQMLGLLHSLWRDSWGPRTNDVLHAGLLTLAGQPGASLVGLPMLFTNDHYRRKVAAQAVQRDPWGLDAFWGWFDALSPEQRAHVLGPVMSKLRSFLMRPTMRAILGQPSPRFDLAQVFTERKILLVNLAKGSVGPEAAALLGSIVVSQLWQATQSRSQVPAGRRHPVMVYVDEFQDYLHLPTDFADVLAQARGLGVGMTLSHQHLTQLTPEIRDAVIANAQSRVLFRLGDRDAKAMAAGHRELTPEDLAGLGRYEIYTSLVTDSQPTPYASGITTDLPPASSRPDDIRARSRARFGVPAAETDTHLSSLLDHSVDADLHDGPGGEFGVRKRTP